MCCHRHQSALLQLLVTLDWTPLVHTLMNRHHAGYAQHPQGPICTTELCDSLSLAIQQPAMLGNVLIVSSGGQKKTPKQDKSDQNKSMWFAKDNSDCSSFITMNGLTIQTSFLLFYEYRDDQCFIANRTRLMDPIHQLHSRVCESWKKRKKAVVFLQEIYRWETSVWTMGPADDSILSSSFITGHSVSRHYKEAWNLPRYSGGFGGLPSLQDSRIWQDYIHSSHPQCSSRVERRHAGICLQSVVLLAGIRGKLNHSLPSHHALVTGTVHGGTSYNATEEFGCKNWKAHTDWLTTNCTECWKSY